MAHAVITGGSSGIGLAIATRLWKQNYDLTLIARNLEKLEAVKSEFLSKKFHPHQQITIFALDVSDAAAVNQAIASAQTTLGSIDLLINNAGVCTPGHFVEQPPELFETTMAVNYFGSLYMTQAVLPQMLQSRRGQIIFIASGVGLMGLYGYSSYSPTKFALRGLAESLRGELKPQGIEVSIVYPPDTDTPQLARENQIKPAVTKKLSESAKVLSADEVAQAVIGGLQRGQFLITPGLEMTVLARFHSLIFPLLNRYFDGMIAKMLKS